ncbi:hypothetical protein M440DRAFT_1446787 [Trichoderma longibrachiatum ATCC 18648]|uniref:Uncharacterized protein n=1 Tax=Trichoderma longibrachiatum ATCC 18648 TaxID=983965 RepID=A0A2T4BVI9_TRILO|nr:hypothetical protein M440DRAFT_1446787 [Trichoderma longibrachiatum ATCC 18648]
MPNAQQGGQRQGASETRGEEREREKAVDESRQAKGKEATKLFEGPSKRRQHSGICGRMPRLPVVRPSPVDKSWWAVTCLLTTINHRPSPLHLGPIESWPCVGRPAPPRIAELCACAMLGLAPKYRIPSVSSRCGTASHHSGDSCLQACTPASSARPTVELAPWREETCSCWQEEGSKRTNVCSCLHAAVAPEPPPSIAAPALSLRPGVFHLPGTLGGLLHRPLSPDV